MLDLVTACWIGVLGACIGSFLNVVAYRMPRGMSVVWKPSHCPRCSHPIRARDNLPVLGWLLLRGRCRDCGGGISPRYAIVEAAMGAAFFALAYVELFSGGANLPSGALVETRGAAEHLWNGVEWRVAGLTIFHGTLLALLMAMALVDLDRQRVPAKLAALAALAAAAGAWRWPSWYPERIRTTYVRALKAPLDALAGAAWGAMPPIAVAAAARRRLQQPRIDALLNAAAMLGTIGAFLGLHAAVRITLAWLAALLLLRALPARWRLRPLVLLWPLTLAHILFWRQVAPWLNW